jgi:hypothetical protein
MGMAQRRGADGVRLLERAMRTRQLLEVHSEACTCIFLHAHQMRAVMLQYCQHS